MTQKLPRATHAARLRPGDDLRKHIEDLIMERDIRAGFIITCVGSLKTAVLRLADETSHTLDGPFEIVSLTGTLCPDGVHLHMSIADDKGSVYGGHVKHGCIVHTTAELIIGNDTTIQFTREHDPTTGFEELTIHRTDTR